MKVLSNACMAKAMLHCLFGLLSLVILSQSAVLAQPIDSTSTTPMPGTNLNRSNQMAVRLDSLSRSVQMLSILVNSELRANSASIESIKDATDRSFWVFIVLGTIGSFIGGAYVVAERARERMQHQNYMEERTFYEQRAQQYEQRQQEVHQQMLNIAKATETRNDSIHNEILQIYKHHVTSGQETIEQTKKLFELLETNFEKVNSITGAVASGASKNVETLNEVLTAFQNIMQFKVVEAKEASDLVQRMKDELNELEATRKQQVDELLKNALRLIRKRFEYGSPDPDLQRLTEEFRTKMDGIPNIVLMKYTDADSAEPEDWRYGEIFLRRGVIAYCENDPVQARDMLRIAERFFPFKEDKLESMPADRRIATAFTRYYLALIEKNYGDIRRAQDYIEKSFIARGRDEDNELLTPTARAEILSYAPGGIDKAREAIEEIIRRVENLKRGGLRLAKHDATCAVRAHLILGNTYYLEGNWTQALVHYQDALIEDEERFYSYYALHSISQAQRKLGKEPDANEMLERAYKHLLQSRHLETKVALDTRISLNALAYLCTRAKDKNKALVYQQGIQEHWLKIQKIGELELRLFSLEQKRQVNKEEFWKELFSG